jgi:hypothetical protein
MMLFEANKPQLWNCAIKGTCELFITYSEQMNSSRAGIVHLNSFHIFTKKTTLAPQGTS